MEINKKIKRQKDVKKTNSMNIMNTFKSFDAEQKKKLLGKYLRNIFKLNFSSTHLLKMHDIPNHTYT